MIPEIAIMWASVSMSSRVGSLVCGCCCDALFVIVIFGVNFCSVCTVVLVVAVVRAKSCLRFPVVSFHSLLPVSSEKCPFLDFVRRLSFLAW